MENLVRLSKIGDDFAVRRSTLYKWKHMRKYPGLFVKVGGAVFIDMRVFEKIVEKGRQR